MIELVETEEQAEARLRAAKARRALGFAPALAFELAGQILPEGGRTERGEDVSVQRIPFRGHVVDDLNSMVALLVEGVTDFAHQLGGKTPAAARPALMQYRVVKDPVTGERYGDENVFGLPLDRIVPDTARDLTRDLTLWLVTRPEVFELPGGPEFADDIARTVWALRFRYQLTPLRERDTAPRPCPVCGQLEVRVEFFGQPFVAAERRGEFDPIGDGTADERRDPKSRPGAALLQAVAGIDARCGHCGWTVEPRASQILRWLL
jgi:hypothetical protein